MVLHVLGISPGWEETGVAAIAIPAGCITGAEPPRIIEAETHMADGMTVSGTRREEEVVREICRGARGLQHGSWTTSSGSKAGRVIIACEDNPSSPVKVRMLAMLSYAVYCGHADDTQLYTQEAHSLASQDKALAVIGQDDPAPQCIDAMRIALGFLTRYRKSGGTITPDTTALQWAEKK